MLLFCTGPLQKLKMELATWTVIGDTVLGTSLIGIAIIVAISELLKYKWRRVAANWSKYKWRLYFYLHRRKLRVIEDSNVVSNIHAFISYHSHDSEWLHRNKGLVELQLGDSSIVPAGEGADPGPHIDWPPPPPPQPVEI